jgi:DNA-binding beta-propeller fold protein YncE
MPYQISEATSHKLQATSNKISIPLVFSFALLAFGSLLLTGCTSAPPRQSFDHAPVYPAPPDKPRYIYERTLQTNEDVEKISGLERFKIMVTGRSPQVRGLVKPYGVAVHQGRVYVTDTAQDAVLLFDIPGGRFVQFGQDDPGGLQKPIGITISKQGEVFVADVTARRVLVYDLDGHYLRTLGSDELLRRPVGVAVSPDGTRLYVVDVGGISNNEHHVQVLDPKTGKLLQTIGARGVGDGQFNLPLQAATGPDGTLYVVDGGNFRVEAFDPKGKFLFKFGQVGRFPGDFARPKGIATDKEGHIYVVDTAFGNVQIFNKKGQVLMFIGNRDRAGKPGKFFLPAGVAVGEDGRVYMVDQYFRKIEIFKPLSGDPTETAASD